MTSRRLNARDYLQDMIEACVHIQDFTSGKTQQDFSEDVMTQFAVVRAIELLGEAAKQLLDLIPEAESRFPSLPLREMYATRNRLIHGYASVLPQTVWEITFGDVPALKQKLESLLASPFEEDC